MARMVNISEKRAVMRQAVAEGFIKLRTQTMTRLKKGGLEKGDAVEIARVAGIMAAKKTSSLLPLCHNIPLDSVEVEAVQEKEGLRVRATVSATSKTGVEMEALAAVSIALLTVWDVVKRYEKDEKGQYPFTEISGIRVVEKFKSAE